MAKKRIALFHSAQIVDFDDLPRPLQEHLEFFVEETHASWMEYIHYRVGHSFLTECPRPEEVTPEQRRAAINAGFEALGVPMGALVLIGKYRLQSQLDDWAHPAASRTHRPSGGKEFVVGTPLPLSKMPKFASIGGATIPKEQEIPHSDARLVRVGKDVYMHAKARLEAAALLDDDELVAELTKRFKARKA